MSGGRGGRLGWYARRLASMSPVEIAHRMAERGKQYIDAKKSWGWSAFAFEGDVAPWPGLRADAAAACMSAEVEAHARAVLAGDIAFLSVRWPKPARADWWRSDTWTLDPVSGEHWPGREAAASKGVYRHAQGRGDVKLVWELNRLQFLMPLAAAARRDKDAALAATIGDVIDGWMEANPPYQGVNWTNGIEFATRVVVILFVVSVLGEMAPAKLRAALKPFLMAHTRMLARYPSLFSSANNHRVAELAALYVAFLCAPDLQRAVGAHPAARELEDEVLKQFHADGVGAEQSPTYAAYSLEWFLLAALAGESAGATFSDAYAARLRRASEHLRWMMDGAGRTPAIGDDDEGRVVALGPQENYLYPAAVVATAARWFNDQRLTPPAQQATLLDAFCAAPALGAAWVIEGQKTFADGGYSVWRNGAALLAFDHAPLGFLSIAAHGHADALAVWLHLGDEPVIVDAGTFLYHTDTGDRDRFRGTLAHNTLALDGQNQSTIAGPFNWSDHAKSKVRDASAVRVVAEHDGYLASHGVKHVRSVREDGAGFVIEDALEGALRAPARWSIGYTLHPTCRAELADGVCVVTCPSGARVRLRVESATVELAKAEFSPGFGKRVETQRLIASGEISAAGAVTKTTIEILA